MELKSFSDLSSVCFGPNLGLSCYAFTPMCRNHCLFVCLRLTAMTQTVLSDFWIKLYRLVGVRSQDKVKVSALFYCMANILWKCLNTGIHYIRHLYMSILVIFIESCILLSKHLKEKNLSEPKYLHKTLERTLVLLIGQKCPGAGATKSKQESHGCVDHTQSSPVLYQSVDQ